MTVKRAVFKPAVLGMVVAAAFMTGAAYAEDAASVDVDKLFKEGVYQREQGNLFTAIEAFQTVLSTQPALHRARLELAVTYYRSMNYEEAQAQAKIVLDDPKTPQNVRLAVLAFMAQLKKDQEAFLVKQHVFEPSVSLGLLYDTNVNAGPNSDVVPGGAPLTPGSMPRSDTAVVLQAGLSHRYNAPKVVQVGEAAARFSWQSMLNMYRRGYFSEHDFSMNVLSVSTGPAWLAPKKWRANLNLQLDDINLGAEHLAIFTSLSPSISWDIRNGEITWDAVLLHKDFKRTVDAGRDSDYASTGISFGKMVGEGNKVAVQAGVRVFEENAGASRFSNDGTEIFIGANYVAWENGSVFGRISQKDAKHDGVEPIYLIARDETENRYEIGLNHNFKEGWLNGWKLGASYQETRNSSNVSIFTYKREMTSVNLSRSF